MKVVDDGSEHPIPGTLIAWVQDPLAPLQPGSATWTSDAQGLASLSEPGWYVFHARDYSPRCAEIAAPDSGEPREVRLSRSGHAALRLVTVVGQPLTGVTVRAWSRRSLVEGDPTTIRETRPAADVGQSFEAITDQSGVARFEGLSVGKAAIAAITLDYTFARREALEIAVSAEPAPPIETLMHPIAVGAVVIDGLPGGWWLQPVCSFPGGWTKHPSFSQGAPVDAFAGQMTRIQQRQRDILGKDQSRAQLLGAVGTTLTSDRLEAVAEVKLAWLERSGTSGSQSVVPRIMSDPTTVTLKPPSAWTAADSGRLSVSREGFGKLTEVQIRFETEDGSAAAGCPAVLQGAAMTFNVPKEDASQTTGASVWVPPGAYQLKPDLMSPWEWKAAFTFEPVKVVVGDNRVEVIARLTHPICLVALDVRDELGRPIKSFAVQTRRAYMGFTKGAHVLPIDENEWELAIAGVADAGYEGVPKHTKKLERGRLKHPALRPEAQDELTIRTSSGFGRCHAERRMRAKKRPDERGVPELRLSRRARSRVRLVRHQDKTSGGRRGPSYPAVRLTRNGRVSKWKRRSRARP